jgi:hypothetical protein
VLLFSASANIASNNIPIAYISSILDSSNRSCCLLACDSFYSKKAKTENWHNFTHYRALGDDTSYKNSETAVVAPSCTTVIKRKLNYSCINFTAVRRADKDSQPKNWLQTLA